MFPTAERLSRGSVASRSCANGIGKGATSLPVRHPTWCTSAQWRWSLTRIVILVSSWSYSKNTDSRTF